MWVTAINFAILNQSVLPETVTYVPYKDTGFFSRLVSDYLSHHPDTAPLYTYTPDAAGIADSIRERAKYPVDRKMLAAVLGQQYTGIPKSELTGKNIQSLLSDDTFTVCTAHQPNLMTGYLYFVYKILHAIKLTNDLNAQYPDKHFVPVYYMGSEDNDLEELGTFRFRGNKYTWDGNGQTGAVGRMGTRGLKTLVNDLLKQFGPPGANMDVLEKMLTAAYLKHDTVGAATRYLVNELFGRYGLVIIDPDDATLKNAFVPVMKDELLNQCSCPIVTSQVEKFGEQYKVQAHPRPLNLFYLSDNLRERIEKTGDKWEVVNTDIKWTQAELETELAGHPERFSPNVILRGLYQETILPNVAFIGGGAEVAYWLQLKTLFEHYHVFYPCILLRQSVLWASKNSVLLREQLEFTVADLFKAEEQLKVEYISGHTTNEWKTDEEVKAITAIFNSIQQKATSLDPTLKEGAAAALTKMRQQLALMEKKMLRAEKRKMEVQMQRIARLKATLFSGGSLQERIDNFMEYYLDCGPSFFDTVKDAIKPLEGRFLVIENG